MCAVGVYTGKGAATKAAVACARAVLGGLYRVFCLIPRRDEVLLFSRQANEPSRDFVVVGEHLAERGLSPVFMTKKLSARSFASYLAFAVREVYHLARCRACVLDRYDPIVSLLDLRCEAGSESTSSGASVAGSHGLPLFDEFPSEPVVVQMWHALGAFKKFGYQSLGTPESHPVDTARIFRIHRNCSWVLCSGEGARLAFAEAFNVPASRVRALPRPEYFHLREVAAGRRADGARRSGKPRVLFAPTLRKNPGSAHPLRDLRASEVWRALEPLAEVVWSLHPLEERGTAAADVSADLLEADYVVTDYSSVAYEAYLLGVRVLFYVPDLEEYRVSPGLNSDPGTLCPDLCFQEGRELVVALEGFLSGERAYPAEQLDTFASPAFDGGEFEPSCIADFVCGCVRRA